MIGGDLGGLFRLWVTGWWCQGMQFQRRDTAEMQRCRDSKFCSLQSRIDGRPDKKTAV